MPTLPASTAAPDARPRLVIVGGGFAGATLARLLRRQRHYAVTLVSEESYTTFNPMLAEVVGATVFPEHVVAPLRQTVGAARFIMGTVSHIDFAGRILHCDTLKRAIALPYDRLVLAFGQRARVDVIEGLAEHAVVLKTVGDAMHVRNLVLRRLAQIELEDDTALRRALGHFVIVGGGFSGVEVAGAIADSLREIRRYYPRVAATELQVTLLQGPERLLPELPACLGDAAAASLRRRGVDVRTRALAARIGARELTLDDGSVIASATTICTIGTAANALLGRLPALPVERGRIVCTPHLGVVGMDHVHALGDCARIVDASGMPSPPTAQFAVAQARHLARSLRDLAAGRPTRPFTYRARGMMATVGHMKGVAQIFGVRMAGLPAWLAWRAYYLSQMPTLGRKLRIFVEWTWGMFFPPDITHFRFTRTHALLQADRSGSMPDA